VRLALPRPVRHTEPVSTAGSDDLTCTGTPYALDPCNCIYHVLMGAFPHTPSPVSVSRCSPAEHLPHRYRAFSPIPIYRKTLKAKQRETLWPSQPDR
jgi:hypothetical protein